MALKVDAKFEWRTDLLLQKWQEKIGEFSPKHPKFSKVCTFIDSCCAEYLMFYLKKYRGIIFQDTEDMQNLKKNWLVVRKMTWEI